MWAARTASILFVLTLSSAEEAQLKWSKPASERVSGDWVPLSAEQLGQASARSLGAPSQRNHLVQGLYQEDNGNNFANTFHQPPQFRPDNAPRQQEKFNQPQVLSQQFLPPQIPPHLLAQQLPPQLLNQQFENTFNQFPHNAGLLRPHFVVPQNHFGQPPPPPPVRKDAVRQHAVPEEKLPVRNLQNPGFASQQNSFADSRPNHQQHQQPVARPVGETVPYMKGMRGGEKEEVQILYVPVETLKQRGKASSVSNGVSSQDAQGALSREPTFQSLPQSHHNQKETQKFRHPIQPLKEQIPARHLTNVDFVAVPKSTPLEQPQRAQEEYDSTKDTSQQVSSSELKQDEQAKYVQTQPQNYNTRYPTEEAQYDQTNFRQYHNEKELYTERPRLEYNLKSRFTKMPDSFLLPEDNTRRPAEVYRDEVRPSKLPPPNQPPLSVYMETSPNSKVGDVLSLLKDAKTIPVLDTIGPDSPQVFVGPSNLKPPHGYVKFELPYLSSLDGNRVERKVLQLPFFVAPLNFQPPPGYSKIPFPPPHIGSVVLSNYTARAVTEKYATTPSYSVSSSYRDPYTIPADISSISPQLPSLINSLQEEQYGPTTLATTSTQEVVTEAVTEEVQTTTTPRRTQNTRGHNYRGSQKAQFSAPTSSATRRPYGQRQRRPYNSRTQSRVTTTTTTTEEPYTNVRQSLVRDDQVHQDQHTTQNNQRNFEDRYHESAVQSTGTHSNVDDSTTGFLYQQSQKEPEDKRLVSEPARTKELDRNFRTQAFVPQYTTDYYNPQENANVYEKEKTPSTRDPVEPQSPPATYRSQPQPENQQSVYSSFESQFSPRPVNHDQNSQFAVAQGENDKSLRTNSGYSTEATLQRQKYKENADQLPYSVFRGPSVGIGQLPPEYREDEARTKTMDTYFPQSYENPTLNVDEVAKPQEVPSYDVNYKPVQYTTQRATENTQPDYKEYPSSSSRNNLLEHTTSVVTDPPMKPVYKSENLYGNEEVSNPVVKQKTFRPTHEQTSSDEYSTKTTSENYVETTTRAQPSERPHLRSRGRVRGRPLYSRQKTTTEPPNYPSNFGESREQSYKEEKRVNGDFSPNSFRLGVFNNDDTPYTTSPPTEATTRTTHRKLSNHRTVQRRPLRPTTTPAPSTTTSAPSGVKYLIRTRRPSNPPQTKLHASRGRIRRPTTPTTTTTTEASVLAETEPWTVPQLPNFNYRDEDASYNPVSVKGSQYDSFSRSPVVTRDENKFEQYQTTPNVSGNERFTARPKSQEVSYVERDEDTYLQPVRKIRPTQPPAYDEGLEYVPYNQDTSPEPVRKVTFKSKEPQFSYEAQTEQYDNYQNYETSQKTLQRHREPYVSRVEQQQERVTNQAKTTGKHRGTSPPSVYYQEQDFEPEPEKTYRTTRRPLARHRESQTNPPAVYNQAEGKGVYQSDDESPHVGLRVEVPDTNPTPQPYSDGLPLDKNYKHFTTTQKIAVYKEPAKETYSEDKYLPDSNPKLIPDKNSAQENKYNSKSSKQKEAEDFWNQAVTIQQSKSYVYEPDDVPSLSDQSKKGNGKSNNNQPVFNEYDDYSGFQDPEKPITLDQSPFPSNDQQVTYTGLKPNVNVGKESQYPEKDTADEPAKAKDDPAESQEKPASVGSPTVEASSQETTSESVLSTTRKPGKRRGTWVRVRVKKPKDFLETAESQRFGSLSGNSLPVNPIKANEKKMDQVKETVDKLANQSKEVDSSMTDTTTEAPSVMEQYQNTLTTMIRDYMKGGNEEGKEKQDVVDETTQATTEAYDTTTIPTTTEFDQTYTTSKIEDGTLFNSEAPSTTFYPQTVTPKVLGTSTTTEISLETEICYKGRCVKTKRGKDTGVKDESDLMTVE
ncbi:uncharacterized protein LOC106668918 [Cimex lectularius]|uniref:Uncharacterized protein n=1 Tax=Cimex lectularius TaxID=79782 RepID=A0A8I6TJ14_CIMLE|nr:uncharacterized protein LOC106668918 [Cimex lectularius]